MNRSTADVSRRLSLLSLALNRPEATPEELAATAGVPVRQACEDLFASLLLCGVPPYLPHHFVSCVVENGRVRVAFADQFRRPIGLTPPEALALGAALESVYPGADGPAAALLAKIESTMPEESRRRWRALRRALVRAPDDHDDLRVLLEGAARRRFVVRLRYAAAGSTAAHPRRLGPLGLFENAGSWYLAAVDVEKSAVRTFRLDRIRDAHAGGERFERPAGFDLAAEARRFRVEDEGATRALVRAGPRAARRVAEVAEPGSWRPRKGGGTWRPRFYDAAAFAATLFEIGVDDLTVVRPAALRRAVAAHAAAVRDAHGG